MPSTSISHAPLTSSRSDLSKPQVSIEIETSGRHHGGHQIFNIGNINSQDSNTIGGKSSSVPFFGFDLQTLSTTYQFLILTTGVFFCYLLYGISVEKIFSVPGLKPHGWYVTLIQFGIYAVISKLELIHQNHKARLIPLHMFTILALVQLVSMGFSYASLQYLNYPTNVIFKSCKLIPVLIGEIVIQRKPKGLLDLTAAIVMSYGLTVFILADSKVSPSFNILGVLMVATALVADAILGNLQETVMKKYPEAVNAEYIYYIFTIGFIYLLFGLFISGELINGFQAFASEDSFTSYGVALISAITGFLGIKVVLTMVRQFGAFTSVAVTSIRKAFSIAISFILFSKPFTSDYVVGGLIVLCGIYMNFVAKDKKNIEIILRWTEKIVNGFCDRKIEEPPNQNCINERGLRYNHDKI